MKRIVPALIVIFLAVPALAMDAVPGSSARREEGGIEWQMYGVYSLDVLKFSTTRGDANFTGKLVGAGLQQRLVTKRGQGFATRGEINFRSGTNTANERSTSENESLSASSFLFGVRLYLSELFIGVYGTFMPVTVKYTNVFDSGRNTERKYNGFGLGFELGVDVFVAGPIFITPRAEYQFYSAQPASGTTEGLRVVGYSFGLGAGFVF